MGEPDPWPAPSNGKKTALTLPEWITKLSDVDLRALIKRRAKELVLTGTGFGKTQIWEMFFGLFNRRVIVLVLNPLDSLGNDQVFQNYSSVI